MSEETKKNTENKPAKKENASSDVKKAVKKPASVEKAVPAKKRYSFEQWLVRRAIPTHHKRGMRAYVKNIKKSRTLEEWDEAMKGY